MTVTSSQTTQDDLERLKQLREAFDTMRAEIARVVIGQDTVIEELLMAIFARGHCILVGVPGLAKTLLVSTLSRVLSLTYKRIQFTPDLMPADITGTEVIQEDPITRERKFVFLRGPIFANMILADEINRTPPKTQAALLEAMQEHRVTVGGHPYPMAEPFFVLATQNPIEQEGTYPLPEAQLDRFMFMIVVTYPSPEEEVAIMKATTGGQQVELKPVLTGEDILKLQDIVRRIPVGEHVFRYAVALARATRPTEPEALDIVRECVSWGAGPRASQYLILGAKARAALYGRPYVTTGDVASVALPVLRHRIVTNFNAEAEGISADTIVQKLLERIPRPTDPDK
ncbi:MAG TPA: MoxR family ATPase [Chthonomonas sp.]|jgi:MoxR-like ATPase|uniref:AAA family ATPase n=1 Tax=Chthonomonas sp. TaxID=2282153 RepID=UPI002B4B835A|nr:MoxR family ATPase [Chthonomonas sp.]HLH80166.1 MoxR family ATPase [Chthonomonas sp.]